MQRILVKAAPGVSETKLTFGAATVPFEAKRLFRSIDSPSAQQLAADDVWYVLSPPKDATPPGNAWDACHALLQQGFGVAGMAAPKFAEPDIEQKWITGNLVQGGQS